jgi:hypothetical protein
VIREKQDPHRGEWPVGRNSEELSHQLGIVRKRNRSLKLGVGGLIVLLVLVASLFYHFFVWRYAVLEEMSIKQDASQPTRVYFTFKVKSGGLIERGFGNAISEDELATGDAGTFVWQWHVPETARDFTVYARSRWAIFPTWQTRTFSVSSRR